MKLLKLEFQLIDFNISLFLRLDYCGIALLIMGSFVPWLYYGFYCHFKPKMVYLCIVCALGVTSIVVSLWDKFSESTLRPLRAGVFMTFGLSGIVPAIHYGFVEGWFNQISQQSLGWLVLMGKLSVLKLLYQMFENILNMLKFLLLTLAVTKSRFS